MRLLFICYEMDQDSPVLAWSARVAEELAGRVDQLVVLTEKVGRLPHIPNMVVHEMPRRPLGIPRRLGSGFLILPQVDRLIKDYNCDACFIHMAHRWAYRFWPAFKRHHIPVVMWYAHGAVNWHLKLALAAVEAAVTSTPEGLRLLSPKVHVIGQGIDARLFSPPATATPSPEIVSVGRLSPRKRPMLAVDVLAALCQLDPQTPWRLKLVGPCLGASDEAHLREVKHHIAALGLEEAVDITGPLTQAQTVDLYQTAALHLNVSQTGSMDKTVLESLACGCPVVTTNEAFQAMPEIFCPSSDATDLAKALLLARRNLSAEQARALVVGQHDLTHWADNVMALLQRISR